MVADGGGGATAASGAADSAEKDVAAVDSAASAVSVASAAASSVSLADVRRRMEESDRKALVKGDVWYLVDTRWYKQLRTYLGQDPDGQGARQPINGRSSPGPSDEALSPGPVDNAPIFKDGGAAEGDIREHMIDELDYRLVPEEAWKVLVGHFGAVQGQKPVARKVVEQGMFVKHCRVEVYFIELLLAHHPDTKSNIRKAKFSKSDTLDTICKEMRREFTIADATEIRLWNKYTADTYEHLPNMDLTVQDAGLYGGQLLLIESRKEDGTWPRIAKNTSSLSTISNNADSSGVGAGNNNASGITIGRTHTIVSGGGGGGGGPSAGAVNKEQRETATGASGSSGAVSGPISTRYNFGSCTGEIGPSDKVQPGLCGLSNLGNTCFMNSIIQGLSNCPPITEYFANDNYVEDINEDNPLGMRGEIARSFGELIKSLWSGRYSYFVPRNFKMAVGRFAPQFSGYQQQDSQELLTFLLDGLHEDLNRIKKKPYIELKDSDDRADEEVAKEAWEMYKMRNDSVILDLFHGLLKSTVVCPECPKISVTFDPFCYLSLPLPVRKERRIDVFLVYEDVQLPPKQFKVTVAKNGCMADLCKALSQLSGVQAHKMVVTDVYNHRFHKIYGPDDALSHILDRDDIFVYEVQTTNPNDLDWKLVPVYLREKKSSLTYSPSNLFGQPLLLAVPRRTPVDYEALYSLAVARLGRIVRPPGDAESDGTQNQWWKKGSRRKQQQQQKQQQAVVNGSRGGADGESDDRSGDSSPSSSSEAGVSIPPPPPPPPPIVNGDGNDVGDGNKVSSSANEDADMDGDGGSSEEEEEEEEDDGRGPPKLFAMNLVNSYGNAQLEQLENDGKPINISGKMYLSLDWHSRAKELFYDEKEAERFVSEGVATAAGNLEKQQKKVVRLEECLELYTTKEKLGENDAWYCPSCKKHQQATKKFDLWSLPALLVISLKRFSYNRYWRDKLDTPVEFPLEDLDMSPYIINSNHGPAIYDLVAVSNHYGGMGGGHYTAYAKNKDDRRWYYFDDSSVTASSPDAVVSKAAYVLFYQRRDLTQMLPSSRGLPEEAGEDEELSNGVAAQPCRVNGDASSVEDMDTN